MHERKLILGGAVLGSWLGSWLPSLWGANAFSLSSIFFTAVGGFLGIYLTYKFLN